jgi:hypothetical protein
MLTPEFIAIYKSIRSSGLCALAAFNRAVYLFNLYSADFDTEHPYKECNTCHHNESCNTCPITASIHGDDYISF